MKSSKLEKIAEAFGSAHPKDLVGAAIRGSVGMEGFHVGDSVSWNSEAGHVTGTIVKIHTSDFKVNGYTHHCTKDNPQYEIKSSKTSHVAYHKAAALHKVESSKESLEEPEYISLEHANAIITLEKSRPITKKPDGKNPFPDGTSVWYHYRSAVGHGTVIGVAKYGTTWDKTEYLIRETDHHVSSKGSKEKPVVKHYGAVLHHGKGLK